MCQQTRARREADALKPTVRHPNQTHHDYCRTESKEHVHQCRRAQTEGHKSSDIRAVAEKPIRKLRYAIEHSVKREKQTQLRFLEPKTALQHRHCDAEVDRKSTRLNSSHSQI